jgi:TorA maturation chaperone TorD/DNA-binding transcriptional regulator YdaS (Cro superfamily)
MNDLVGVAALERAIAAAGGQSALARLIGKSQGHVWHWLKVAKRVPAEAVLAIEEATGVPRHELRPDVYPAADAPAKADAKPDAPDFEIDPDEASRASWYALLGELLADPPSTELLARLAAMDGDPSELGGHVGALAAVARRTSAREAGDEFSDLFIGLARGELQPYASFYRTGFLNEKPLANLRAAMAELGIARAAERPEPEDHIASLCEMMAGLIVGAFGAPASLEVQAAFFEAHVAPWAEKFFADLASAKAARLYMPVGQIGRVFIEIERAAFAMREVPQTTGHAG